MPDIDKFRFSIDRGGTFTDVYAEVPCDKGYRVAKLLSEDPRNYPDAPREGIRRIMEETLGQTIPPDRIDASRIEWIRMGTTVATNALLERKGARCALLITKGFRDVLQIGNQDRPRIFDLKIQKPDLLYEDVVEVDERLRILKDGEAEPEGATIMKGVTGERFVVLKPLDPDAVASDLKKIFERGIESVAVVLMHAYACPDHEVAVGKIAEELGFSQVSLSSRIMPRIKLVARGDTTMTDAYLNPHIRDYLEGFKRGFSDGLSNTSLLFMQSDGGLARADAFTGSRAILSGPAGGVVGYAIATFDEAGGKPVIGFDMGGTSTDVSRYAGEYELVFETETAGVRIQAPQLHIRTVAAGGGSRLFFENGMFAVGPESTGAHPGPVCYRKDGHLAVTDANLVLGRIRPEYFPKIFGETKDLPLDADASRESLRRLTEQINAHCEEKGVPRMTVEEVALGFVRVANEAMVRPIREISVMRGFDVKEHVLAAFGGAGPQHACAIASALGITEIFISSFLRHTVCLWHGHGRRGGGPSETGVRRLRQVGPPGNRTQAGKAAGKGQERTGKAGLFPRGHGRPGLSQPSLPGDRHRHDGRSSGRRRLCGRLSDRLSSRIRIRPGGTGHPDRRHPGPCTGKDRDLAKDRNRKSLGSAEKAGFGSLLFRERVDGHGHLRSGKTVVGTCGRRPGHPDTRRHHRRGGTGLRRIGHANRRCTNPSRTFGAGKGGRAGGSRSAVHFRQPVHVHRRTDGPHAAEDLHFHQHQGAPGFFLRPLWPGGRAGGQRAAPAGPLGFHERRGQGADSFVAGRPFPLRRPGLQPSGGRWEPLCRTSR